ncbi:hypothetical protein DFP73DRAFT_546662 [Morchella snyderi]|nr:hypothetical protein DFP73DRAFT_546662 [Morchella snyderi]
MALPASLSKITRASRRFLSQLSGVSVNLSPCLPLLLLFLLFVPSIPITYLSTYTSTNLSPYLSTTLTGKFKCYSISNKQEAFRYAYTKHVLSVNRVLSGKFVTYPACCILILRQHQQVGK